MRLLTLIRDLYEPKVSRTEALRQLWEKYGKKAETPKGKA
jgi:hypothetical protein